jgi:hypothetical protein
MSTAGGAVRVRPSFVLYLTALALFPFQWLSPFTYEQAGWSDIFIAAAAGAWVLEALHSRRISRLRAPHYAYGAYFATVVLSAVFAGSRATGVRNALITGELIALAVITADYARSFTGRRAIARVIVWVTLLAAVQGAVGLALFYFGHSTSLVSGYSSYFTSSHLYTRLTGGFYSPALLGSFCIFASAILAMGGNGLSRRMRIAGQALLAVLVIATLSRPAVGFGLAMAIREAHRRGTLRARRIGAAIVITGVLALVALTVLPLSLDPFQPASSRGSTNPRLAFLKTSVRAVERHPLLGSGPGSLTASWNGAQFRAHSTPLNVAATTGLASLAALTALAIVLWRRHRQPTNVGLWSGVAGLALDGLTQDVEHFRHVWMMLGIADADAAKQGGPSDHRRTGWATGIQPHLSDLEQIDHGGSTRGLPDLDVAGEDGESCSE